MGFKNLMISLILAGVFAFAMLNFGLQLADDNNANISISDDPAISEYVTNINSTLKQTSSDIDSAEEGWTESAREQTPTSEGTFIPAITSARTTVITKPHRTFELTLRLTYEKIFGADAQFNSVFLLLVTILSALILFYGWKLIRSGDPD